VAVTFKLNIDFSCTAVVRRRGGGGGGPWGGGDWQEIAAPLRHGRG